MPIPITNKMLAPGQCTILNSIPIDDKENDNTPVIKANFFIFNSFIS